jgi:hypothetical protein
MGMITSRTGQQPIITPIDTAGVKRLPVPYFINIEPVAQVGVGAIVVVTYTVGPRDFVWTHLGQTTEGVAFPSGAGMPFKVGIQDVGLSTYMQPFRFLARPVVGSNPNTSDNAAFELPVQWRFKGSTTITVEFENIGAMLCLPTIVLVGYLD